MITLAGVVLGTVLPYISPEDLKAYFHFESAKALGIYVGWILGAIVLTVLLSQAIGHALISWGRSIKVKVSSVEYLQEGDKVYFSLRIFNDEKEDLTDCTATLIIAEQYYNSTSSRNILDIINPNASVMSWGISSSDGTVTIPGDHGQRVLNIAYHHSAGRLVFPFQNWTSNPQEANVIYHVKIKIRGKINGEYAYIAPYDGFFRTENYISPPMRVVSGWLADNDEMIEKRESIYGGTPETRFEFLKTDKIN